MRNLTKCCKSSLVEDLVTLSFTSKLNIALADPEIPQLPEHYSIATEVPTVPPAINTPTPPPFESTPGPAPTPTSTPGCECPYYEAKPYRYCSGISVESYATPISLLWSESCNFDEEITFVNFQLDPRYDNRTYSWKGSESFPLLVFDPEKNRNKDGVPQTGEVVTVESAGVKKLFYQVTRRDRSTGSIYADRGIERINYGRTLIGRSVGFSSDLTPAKGVSETASANTIQSKQSKVNSLPTQILPTVASEQSNSKIYGVWDTINQTGLSTTNAQLDLTNMILSGEISADLKSKVGQTYKFSYKWVAHKADRNTI